MFFYEPILKNILDFERKIFHIKGFLHESGTTLIHNIFSSLVNGILAVRDPYIFEHRFCSRYRYEAKKTIAKREVGAILDRRHIHKYVEDQNRETSVAAWLFEPQ